MSTAAVLPIVEVSGQGWSAGYLHGQQRQAAIRRFIDDALARLNKILYRPTSMQALAPTLDAYHAAIVRKLPRTIDEIRGLSAGAAVAYEQGLLLQLRREIVGFDKIPARGDCTTFARAGGEVGPDEAVLAQTVDLNGDMEQEAYILRVSNAGDDARDLVMLTFTGLLGYLGMNSHGLAIGLNLVLGGKWRPGIPAYMAIRHLLEVAKSVDDCVGLLESLDLASSRSFTICDPNRCATVEIVDRELRWRWSPELVHANHFLDPDFEARDAINAFAKNGSRQRLQACADALRTLPGGASTEQYFAILDKDPIRAVPDGNIRRDATVARVVMRPGLRELSFKRGALPETPPQVIRIRNAA